MRLERLHLRVSGAALGDHAGGGRRAGHGDLDHRRSASSNIPIFVRITRGSANAIWAREFVLAARASGKGEFRITIEHVLPNILSILIVQATIQFALAILAEAALSYLGLGTQPPQPSWGRMLNDAQTPAVPVADARGLSGRWRSRSPCWASICSGDGLARPVRSAAGAGAVMSDS